MGGIFTGLAIGKVLIQFLFVTAINALLNAMLAEDAPKVNPDLTLGSRGHLLNTRSSQQPLPRIYGRCRVGINQVYLGTSGSDNKYLHVVGTVGEGAVQGIGQTNGVDQIFLDDEIYTEYGNLIYYEFFTGTSTQNVCATLQNAISEWDDTLRNTAYIYMRLEFDADRFQGLPNITLEVEGLKVFDPRDSSTAYSVNPALAARDLITASSVRGGMEIASGRIDTNSWIDAANYCDTKGWTIGCPIGNPQAVVDNLSVILSTFRGAVIYSDNLFKCRYKDLNYEAPVMDLDEDDIVDSGGSSLRIVQPSIFDTPNAVRIKFLNVELKYQVDDFVKADNTAIDGDGDYREKEIELLGVNSLENVMKLANYYLERFRVNKTVSLVARNRCMALEPMDLIRLTHSFPGWVNKLLRVVNVHFADDLVQLDTIEEESIFYDDIYNLDDHDWHDTILPRPSDPPYSVINVSHSEEVYYYRDRSFTRWKIDFDGPTAAAYPWWDYAEIWTKIGVSGSWTFATKATTDYVLDPVEEGETYYCKMRSVSLHGVKENFDNAYTVSTQIVGVTGVPPDLTSLTAVASGDVVNIYASPVSGPDIAGYEVRLGDWIGGIFIAFNETPNFRLAGIRPGTHTFYCKPKNNSGIYSTNAVSATVTVFYPSGYSEKNSWAWDYNGIGVHDNTEYIFYDSSDCVKCSHDQGDLVGIWTSPQYDLGSTKTVRVWGDFRTTFTSSATSWDGIFPGATTWADKTDADTRWYELTTPDVSSNLAAKIRWGTVSGVYPNEASYFEILAPEFEARYVQVELQITDPQDDANLYVRELNLKAAYWSV